MLLTLYSTDRDRDKPMMPPGPRQLAYHLEDAVHGHVEAYPITGLYLWFPHGSQYVKPQGWLVKAADVVIAPAHLDQITCSLMEKESSNGRME